MTVYANIPIGEIRDAGAGQVAATYIEPSGKRKPLGFFKDRRTAREAIEARHAGGAEPRSAA
jgi:hypothetical protein